MEHETDALDVAATPQRLASLGRAGVLDDAALGRAIELATASPPLTDWQRFLSRALLLLGALLSASGVIYFFAFNWAKLPAWGKLSLLEAAVTLVALSSLRGAAGPVARQVALLTAALLVGPLLGVYGQTYQTGADPWQLFALWAALVAPWSLVARSPALWLLQVVLVDVALGLWFGQVFEGDEMWGAVALGVANGAAWLGWEALSARGVPWARRRWWPRLVASSSLVSLLVPSLQCVFERAGLGGWAGAALEAAAVAGCVGWFRRRDLFLGAAALATAMTVATSWVGWLLFEKLDVGEGGLLVMGALVVAEVGLAVAWLRRAGASREGD